MSGVGGLLTAGMEGDSEVTLVAAPRDGVALAPAGQVGIDDNASGESGILDTGDISKLRYSFKPPPTDCQESRGITNAGNLGLLGLARLLRTE